MTGSIEIVDSTNFQHQLLAQSETRPASSMRSALHGILAQSHDPSSRSEAAMAAEQVNPESKRTIFCRASLSLRSGARRLRRRGKCRRGPSLRIRTRSRLLRPSNGVDFLLKALNVSIRVGNQIINRLIGTVACISFGNEIAAQLGSGENPLLQDSNRNFHTYQAIACSPRRHAATSLVPLPRSGE